MKPLRFVGSTRDDLSAFPVEARRAVGFELWQVQLGATPSDWKPMADVGPGAYEIRVHVLGEWRIIYVVSLRRLYMSFMPFRRKPDAPDGITSNWHADVTKR